MAVPPSDFAHSMTSFIDVDATLYDLPYHQFQVSVDTRVNVIKDRFDYDPHVPAVIILDREGLILNLISRRQFLELMSQPYGLELFNAHPVRKILPFIKTRPTRLSAKLKVDVAAKIILDRPQSSSCTPIVAIAADGLRLIECNTIFLAQSLVLNLLNHRLEQTLAALKHSQQELNATNIRLMAEINERQRIQDQLTYNALHDHLTNLPNRILFRNHLDQAFNQYQRLPERSFVIMFIDLDRFKQVNDSLGHGMGDVLLKNVGDRLLGCMRNVDTVARLGGDEFAVLITDIGDLAIAELCAERIQISLTEPFYLEQHRVTIGASIGIAMVNPQYQSVDELLRDADMAMYEAKRQGQSTYRIFPWSLGIRGTEYQQGKKCAAIPESMQEHWS